VVGLPRLQDHKLTVSQLDFAAINDSDSASSSGVEDNNGVDLSGDEEEDDEDIPMSDIEDLDDEEREDMIPHQRLTINNTTALSTALKRIALPLSTLAFSEHQSLTTPSAISIPDVSDDLTRELAFYSQSLEAVKIAREILKKEGAPFSRPTDYFAEMVKADEHMAKIKGKLIEEAASKKASAEARKQRDLKKFGKQVQVAKAQERDKEKKATMDKIKTLKRSKLFPLCCYIPNPSKPCACSSYHTNNHTERQGADAVETSESALFDVALDEEAKDPQRDQNRANRGKSGDNKRQKKDGKFGFGGKKRYAKSGDAMSSGDMSGFGASGVKGKGVGTGRGASGGGGSKKPRMGKARRAGGKKY
jgi:rRNA-processing protein EBP2